jgi:hypothetical protein
MFRQCLFVDNSVGAIAHFSLEAGQTRLESRYFINTESRGGRFDAGSVLVDSCLFAGGVQPAASFIPTGVQISFASIEISFDTASLPPTLAVVLRAVRQVPDHSGADGKGDGNSNGTSAWGGDWKRHRFGGALWFWSRPWLHTALDRREGCREAPSPVWCSELSGSLLLWRPC